MFVRQPSKRRLGWIYLGLLVLCGLLDGYWYVQYGHFASFIMGFAILALFYAAAEFMPMSRQKLVWPLRLAPIIILGALTIWYRMIGQ